MDLLKKFGRLTTQDDDEPARVPNYDILTKRDLDFRGLPQASRWDRCMVGCLILVIDLNCSSSCFALGFCRWISVILGPRLG